MNKVIKSTLAGVFAFAIIGTSVLPSAQTISTLFDDTSISASAAASCCSFNTATGVLTLSGNVSKDTVQGYKDKAKSVVCKAGTSFPKNCSGLFKNFRIVRSIDLTNANTSSVTDMSAMFESCYALKSLNFGSINTSKVTDMTTMFLECESLITVKNLATLNTKNVTSMHGMFAFCRKMQELNLNNFNTAKVTDMNGMFCCCENLLVLKIDNFDTANVTDMRGMFCDCYALSKLNLSSFDTSKVTCMNGMFEFDTSLSTIYASSKWTTANVKDGTDIFLCCVQLYGGNGSSPINDISYACCDKKGQMGYLSLLGDVDFDGKVTEDDAFLVLDEYTNVMSGKAHILNANQLKVADVDFNGKVELEDAQYILNYTANPDWRKIVK